MHIVALAGGVGGAKLAYGLAKLLNQDELTVIVNTGDDFVHLGLSISPDIDTVCYTLAELENLQTGWGLAGDSFYCLEGIRDLGGPDWFQLGDRDLATHFERTRRLMQGDRLSSVTRSICQKIGILHSVIPMSDNPVRTMVDTEEYGEIAFQEYFVRLACQPKVKGFRFVGVDKAFPASGVIEALEGADTVIICPSNPWVSIDPILSLQGIRSCLRMKVVVAVSPIIQGKTVKGPAAKMYAELGHRPSASAVAAHYQAFLTGIVIDKLDQSEVPAIEQCGIISYETDTLMRTRLERVRLAQEILHFITTL